MTGKPRHIIIAGAPRFIGGAPVTADEWVKYGQELDTFRKVETWYMEAVRKAFGMEYAHHWEPHYKARGSTVLFSHRSIEELIKMGVKATPFKEAMRKVVET